MSRAGLESVSPSTTTSASSATAAAAAWIIDH